jgi:CRISPR-associated Csx2 family protein
MARVFLSFLGTTNYDPCTYTFADHKIVDVRFVQEATITICCRDWTKEDRILIFTTSAANQCNWLDNGHKDKKTGEVIPLEGLQTRLQKLALATPFKSIDIPEGKSQKEIWEIFQILYDHINEGDHVVIDITHAFRSIPMLAMVVLPYARVVKNITIQGIYYGAYEARQGGAAPIFDLTEFNVLLEWTTALDRFIKAGDASMACELAESEVKKKKREIQRPDAVLDAFKNVTNKLGDFCLSLATCRGLKLSDAAGQLKQALQESVSLPGIRPYIPLLQKVQRELDNFPGEHVRDGLAAAQWCADHNLVQQGFTILQETLISHFTVQVLKDDLNNLTSRKLVNQALTILLKELPQEEWKVPAKDNPDNVARIVAAINNYPGMAKILRQLGSDRNDINHAGYNNNPMAADKFAPKLRDYIAALQKFLVP